MSSSHYSEAESRSQVKGVESPYRASGDHCRRGDVLGIPEIRERVFFNKTG